MTCAYGTTLLSGSWLLGDGGYPLSPYPFTPFQQANTEAEESFNNSSVEKAKGSRKQRFHCLSRSAGGLQLYPSKCYAVVLVTALLHNTALIVNIHLLDEDEEMEVEEAEEAIPIDVIMYPDGIPCDSPCRCTKYIWPMK